MNLSIWGTMWEPTSTVRPKAQRSITRMLRGAADKAALASPGGRERGPVSLQTVGGGEAAAEIDEKTV